MNTTVAVGYDRTTPGERALGVAAGEAARRAASLVVITAYHWLTPPEPGALTAADTETTARKAAEEIAQYGANRVRARHADLPVEARAVAGYAGKVLAAASHEADVLVVGNRGAGGFRGMLLGSTSMRTLAEACCPVIVARGDTADAHRRIIAAVDIDENCDTVLDFAFDQAARRGAGLTVTHVWDEPWIAAYGQQDPGIAEDVARIERERDDRLAGLVQAAGARHPEVHPFHQLAVGSAAGLLVEASGHADLLVTGARRHGEGQHGMLLGPVTQTLLQHAECPVTVVPLS
ncbi:universal stress protein [Catenulispora rubra]|uniref:universal stress protein n=1 Tax=Catenulispora rubra TaxID=280293 RepID=UPI0018923245|nr:universal stress protein [Catenulispora rubra]